LKLKSVKIATFKDWLTNKVRTAPLQFSLRYQMCYSSIEIEASSDFNSFNKYFQKHIRGKEISCSLLLPLQEGIVYIHKLKVGSVKHINNLIHITIWTNDCHFMSVSS